MSFNPRYDNLLAAVKDATNTGIKVKYLKLPFCHIQLKSHFLCYLLSEPANQNMAARSRSMCLPSACKMFQRENVASAKIKIIAYLLLYLHMII